MSATITMEGNNITPRELKGLMDKKEDIILIDVREPSERKICSIENSILIPLGQLESRVSEIDKSKETVVHCHHGWRSMQALLYLQSQGFKKVKNLVGGIDAWAKDVDSDMPRY